MSQSAIVCELDIYNPKLLVSKLEINSKDMCGICNKICNIATDIGCKTGDIFCQKCIINISNIDNKSTIRCPSCNERVYKDKIRTNKYAMVNISKYKIYCLYSDYNDHENKDNNIEGTSVVVTNNAKCQWMGELCDALEHIENECEFAMIGCKHCHNSFQRKKMKKHLLNCCMKPIECILKCNKTIIRNNMNKHIENECIEAFITCTNENCNTKIQRKNLNIHLLKECEYRTVNCKYLKFGCFIKVFEKDLEQHLDENEVKHLKLKINSMEKK
eukprot:480869_1